MTFAYTGLEGDDRELAEQCRAALEAAGKPKHPNERPPYDSRVYVAKLVDRYSGKSLG